LFWRRPLLWIAGGWIAGMAVASAYAAPWIAAGCIAACACALAAHGPGRRGAAAALALAASFAAGGAWFEIAESNNASALGLPDDAETAATLVGVVETPPELDGDRIVFDVAAGEAAYGGTERELGGERVKVYVRLLAEAERELAETLRRGDAVSVSGELKRPMPATNFGGFDYRRYLERKRTFWTLHAEGAASVRSGEADRWTFAKSVAVVDRMRDGMGNRLDRLFAEPDAGFMKGLLLGVRNDLDPEQYKHFSQIGLTHILAISGLHVAIFVGTILWLLGKLPITRETRLALAMAAVPAYVALTGASPSVLRAGIMAVIALYAARRGILKDGLHILAAAALLMLAWDPYYLFDVSFQLSFAVTAGLIALVPVCDERLRILRPKALRSAVSVTLVAQLVSFPLTIYYFNGFSLLSFPANLALVPAFSFGVLPLGSIALLLSFVSMPAAALVARGASLLTEACFLAVERLAAFEAASTIWATPAGWWLASYFALLLGGAYAASRRSVRQRARRIAASAFAAALVGLCAYAYATDVADRAAVVSVLDVGQGDAILVRTPSGKHLLIDGGGTVRFGKPEEAWKVRRDPFEVGADVVVPLLKRRGVQEIDALFITHADADHIGGLPAVLDNIPVRRIFFNGTVKPGETSERLFREALRRGIPIVSAYDGLSVRADDATEIRFLFPRDEGALQVEEEQNEASLVFLLTAYSRTFLFTGDIDAAGEQAILDASRASERQGGGGGPAVDVMKVAHHGSKTSTTEPWLDAWKPKAAVISAGRNNIYGHPHPSVTERLQDRGALTFRTDLHGEVQFRVTKESFSVRTMLSDGE